VIYRTDEDALTRAIIALAHHHDPSQLVRSHPHRAALQEPANVFTPDGWDLISETLAKHCQQAVAVNGLFGAHLFEESHKKVWQVTFADGNRQPYADQSGGHS
jgi:hypothetical protein